MKNRLTIMFIFILIFMLSGCNRMPDEYSFPNTSGTVLSVELIHNINPEGVGIDETNFEILCVLDVEASQSFLKEIQSLPTHRRYTGPFWGYGPYFARITYMNGDIEIFGCHHFEFIENGAEPTGFGSYKFQHDDFMKVFSSYYPTDHINGK